MTQPFDKPRITGEIFHDLYNMHARFGFHNQKFDRKALLHRVDFLQEELTEIKLAIQTRDAGGVLDGLIDLIVVAAGTVDLGQADGREAWRRVMEANNAKEVGFNASRPDSEGVDLVKPEGWKAPDLEGLWGNLLSVLYQDHALNRKGPFDEKATVSCDRCGDFHSTDNPCHEEYKFVGGIDPGSKEGDQTVIARVGDKLAEVRVGDYDWTTGQKLEKDRAAVRVLQDCIELMKKKAQDYQSDNSSVQPIDYYPNGISDFVFLIDVLKRFRMISVLDNIKAGGAPNFDTLRDILQDRIVYLALAIEFVDGEMEGQLPGRDIWNHKVYRAIGETQDD